MVMTGSRIVTVMPMQVWCSSARTLLIEIANEVLVISLALTQLSIQLWSSARALLHQTLRILSQFSQLVIPWPIFVRWRTLVVNHLVQ